MTTLKARAAKAICFYETGAEGLWESYEDIARCTLAALAEPSEAMIEAMKESMPEPLQLYWHPEELDELYRAAWKAAHAAMMTEKDTGE